MNFINKYFPHILKQTMIFVLISDSTLFPLHQPPNENIQISNQVVQTDTVNLIKHINYFSSQLRNLGQQIDLIFFGLSLELILLIVIIFYLLYFKKRTLRKLNKFINANSDKSPRQSRSVIQRGDNANTSSEKRQDDRAEFEMPFEPNKIKEACTIDDIRKERTSVDSWLRIDVNIENSIIKPEDNSDYFYMEKKGGQYLLSVKDQILSKKPSDSYEIALSRAFKLERKSGIEPSEGYRLIDRALIDWNERDRKGRIIKYGRIIIY